MKIFMTTGGMLWDPARAVFKPYLDDIVLVHLDERQRVNVEGVRTIKCTSGISSLGAAVDSGFDGPYYMHLTEKRAEIEGLLEEGEDVIVLGDTMVSSLYIFKVLQQVEKKIRLHLWAMKPFSFEGSYTLRKYDEALGKLNNTMSVRITEPLKLIKDKDICLADCIERCKNAIDEMFESYLNKLIFLEDWEVYFYDNDQDRFIFVGESDCEWKAHHTPPNEYRHLIKGIVVMGAASKELNDNEKLKRIKQHVPRPDGKAVCRKLKELRKAFADANNIPYFPEECSYEGPCAGTCEHCDAELEVLTSAIGCGYFKYPQYEIIEKDFYNKNEVKKWPGGIMMGLPTPINGWEKRK